MEVIKNFPLQWPADWKRTYSPRTSKFGRYTIDGATTILGLEIQRLTRQKDFIISTNLKYRLDGLPYSNQAQPADKGVAVYFNYNNRQTVIACDTYNRIECNIYAIAKTIEALRAISRYGSSDLMDKAFTGFKALPAQARKPDWWEILGFPKGMNPSPSLQDLKEKYRQLAISKHPDKGGTDEEFQLLKEAYNEGIKYHEGYSE